MNPLVRYRVWGGPVAVDQRLTVFEDGALELDERHRSRPPISLRTDPTEVEEVRGLLDGVPDHLWMGHTRAAFARTGRTLGLSRAPGTRFEIRRGGRVIVGPRAEDPDLAALVERLDELRLRVLRAHPR